MKSKKIIIFLVLVLTISILLVLIFKNKNNENLNVNNDDVIQADNEIQNFDETQDGEEVQNVEDNTQKVEDVKQNLGMTGNNELYEVQTGDNSTQIVTIKANVKYKVAFAGMMKKGIPTIEESEKILQEKHPKQNGIWIYEQDREKFLKLLKGITKSKYEVDENGYLKIVDKSSQNNIDKKLEKAINDEKIVIIRISSLCYIVDQVTGEILDYNFEKMDKYQTYEYFRDKDKTIIFINENTSKQMETKEIMESVIEIITN